jgi:predicted secreted protein
MTANRCLPVLALAASLAALPALAHEPEPRFNRVTFSVTATEDVANDTLVAVLAVQRDGSSARHLASEVNETMGWALAKSREAPGIEVQTLDYQTIPVYQKSTLTGWRVSQSLRLESKDRAALGDLIGVLQERLNLQHVGYEVSRKLREAVEERLIGEAIAAFQARAKRVAADLQRRTWRLVQMDVSAGGGPAPILRQRAMPMAMAEAAAAPPAIEAGTQTITVGVSGEVELSTD